MSVKLNGSFVVQDSISPTFYELNCANVHVPIKSLTFTSSTKKLHGKLSYVRAARKNVGEIDTSSACLNICALPQSVGKIEPR